MNVLQEATSFIILTLFDLYLFILLLRLILQYLRADFYNPLSQFVVKATSPLIVPLRRIIPGYMGIDLATVLVLLSFAFLKVFLLSLVAFHHFPNIIGLFIWAVGDLIKLTLNLFFYAVLLDAIMSWVAPTSYSPMRSILYRLTDPLLRPARRFIPPIGGFDITPIFVLIALQVLIMLIARPLILVGTSIAL